MESYAALADTSTSSGNELWNAARTAAYIAAGFAPPGVSVSACTFCEGLPEALACDSDSDGVVEPVVYTYPSDPANPAPWYDPADPPSADFAGLIILEIQGWETAGFTRTVLDRVGDGAVLGRGRYLPRTIVVDALLIGRTCCSLRSGLRWLTSTLRNACGPCSGAELDYFECCPGGKCPTSHGTVDDFNHARRTLRQVGLTDGVQVVEKIGRSCGSCNACTYERVQFTLTAGDPYSYAEPTCPAEAVPFVGGSVTDCETFTSGDDCGDDPCNPSPCPASDPDCPAPNPPPDLPLPVGCDCDPIETVGNCVTIESDDVPMWQEIVPIITIRSGSSPLRGIRVKVYNNPRGLPPDQLDDCDICSSFGVNYLQAGATMTIDGRDRRFKVSCPGRPDANGSRLVSGTGGRPFSWPVLNCGDSYTVCVTADSETAAPDANFDVCLVARSSS